MKLKIFTIFFILLAIAGTWAWANLYELSPEKWPFLPLALVAAVAGWRTFKDLRRPKDDNT